MSGRPRRHTKKKNYADLHHGRSPQDNSESSNSVSEVEDEVSINSEVENEFNTTEEGEISDSESDTEELEGSKLDMAIQEAFKKDNMELAENLLKKKERHCEKLKLELALEEKNKELAERKKRKKLMEDRFKKLQEREEHLNRSLASSRGSTPITSPIAHRSKCTRNKMKNKIRRTPGSTDKKRKVRRSTPKKSTCRRLDQSTSEYPNLINNLTNLKHGKADEFTELMAKAMGNKENLGYLDGLGGDCSDKSEEEEVEHGKFKSATVDSKVGQEQLVQLLSTIKKNAKSVQKFKVPRYHQNNRAKDSASNNSSSDDNDVKWDGKKLKSGKCAKPDDTDIKKVVKFAHEKLDVKHVKNRSFDNLTFNLLIAGEIELILLKTTGAEERNARLKIVKILAYHKQYLGDAELREGYDYVLKQVEQGVKDWGDDLSKDLHEFLDYRANILIRSKMQEHRYQETKPNQPGDSTSKRATRTSTEKFSLDFEGDEHKKSVFGMEYNHDKCEHKTSHEGSFSGRKCIKWHFCR